jgi:hypothetical protein
LIAAAERAPDTLVAWRWRNGGRYESAANGDHVGVATARANAEAALVVVREAFDLIASASKLGAAHG